ncbi:MAG: M23 family metallopeptidase, partial [Propionicimonas sp.]|nr:M23 family metallopeptidase [Propionicimonas sp.]
GTDFAPPCDAPIWAAASGTVTFGGPASGYGNWIKIAHDGDVVTTYGHMFTEGVLVRVGDVVQAGQQIGRVGTAGDSTGCHLHFEVLTSGSYVDPLVFLNQHGVQIQGAQS